MIAGTQTWADDQPPSMKAGPQDTGPTGKTYRITRVSDFGKVPPMRLAACLSEFAGALFEMHKKRLDLPLGQDVQLQVFQWTDDGDGTMELRYDKITGWVVVVEVLKLVALLLPPIMVGVALGAWWF